MQNEKNNAADVNKNGLVIEEAKEVIIPKDESPQSDQQTISIAKENFAALEAHAYAEFLPMISTKRELDALKAGILKHGLLEPITIHDGKILDGRNRHRAICELLTYEKDFNYENVVKFAPVPEGFTPEQYVITRNLHRRNLNESQRALFAGLMLLEFKEDRTLTKEQRTNLPEGSKTSHFGKIFNVSGSSVKSAQIVIKRGLPVVKDFVQKGFWRLSLAKKIAELSKEEQQNLVADALTQGKSLAELWYANHCLDLNKKERDLSAELSALETERSVTSNALRHGLAQALAQANLLPEEEQNDKKSSINDVENKIADGTHSSLREHTAKIVKITNRREKYREELKTMLDDQANQKERYAQSKLSLCMASCYKEYIRNRKEASLAAIVTFSKNKAAIEFKVLSSKQAENALGVIKKFDSPKEGEKFLLENKVGLERLKADILNGTLTEAENKIQTFRESLSSSQVA